MKAKSVPGASRHSRSLAGIVLVIEALDTVELLGGRATGSPLTAAVCATHAPKTITNKQINHSLKKKKKSSYPDQLVALVQFLVL